MVQELAYLNRIAGEQGTQRPALDQFTDDVLLPGFDAEIIDADNVRVIEPGDGAGFALKAAMLVGARGAVFAKDFDHDIAVEAEISGAVDLAHAAGPEHRPDLVWAQPGVYCQRHRVGSPYRVGVLLGTLDQRADGLWIDTLAVRSEP
jgi:hypothetical protein